jgi:hypothetical protein
MMCVRHFNLSNRTTTSRTDATSLNSVIDDRRLSARRLSYTTLFPKLTICQFKCLQKVRSPLDTHLEREAGHPEANNQLARSQIQHYNTKT